MEHIQQEVRTDTAQRLQVATTRLVEVVTITDAPRETIAPVAAFMAVLRVAINTKIPTLNHPAKLDPPVRQGIMSVGR
jgi:DNA-binding MurR/RpiR family transcriptional regulator